MKKDRQLIYKIKWIVIYAFFLYAIYSILENYGVKEGFFYTILLGYSITFLSNVLKIYWHKRKFVMNRWFIYWGAVTTFAVWIVEKIVNQIVVESNIQFLLLMGVGLVITISIFKEIHIKKRWAIAVSIILLGIIFYSFNPSYLEKTNESIKNAIQENIMEEEIFVEPVEEILEKPMQRNTRFIESRINALINEERHRNGASSLNSDHRLKNFAISWSEKMINENFFEHSNLDFSFNSYAGENIAETPIHYSVIGCGQTYTDEAIANCFVRGWINSPGHHENMVNQVYSRTGVGVACDTSKCRATQVFEG